MDSARQGPAASPPASPGRGNVDAGRSIESSEVLRRAVADLVAGRRVEASFRVVFDVFYPTVRGFFAKRLAGDEICLDLTQETFLRVYKGVQGYRGEAPFGAWLFRIAWNVLHRHRSRAATRKEVEQTPLEDLATDIAERSIADQPMSRERRPLAAVLQSEELHLLRRAILQLPEQRRKCIVLWAYQGLTYQQIAVTLRLSLGTVKAHLAQARGQLQRLLAEEVTPKGHRVEERRDPP